MVIAILKFPEGRKTKQNKILSYWLLVSLVYDIGCKLKVIHRGHL